MTAQTPSPGHGTDGKENWRGVATEDLDGTFGTDYAGGNTGDRGLCKE